MVLQLLMFTYMSLYMTYNVFAQMVLDDRGHFKVIAAPKGQAPQCVSSKGLTFCEDISDYPYELVLNAIRKSNFDVKKLLVDESTDEGPDLTFLTSEPSDRTQMHPSLRLAKKISVNDFDDFFTDSNGNRLDLTTDRSLIRNRLLTSPNSTFTGPLSFVSQLRNTTNVYIRLPRHSSAAIIDDWILTTNESQSRIRHKRQVTPSIHPGPPLCKFDSRYIYPQTAMCASTGEWMYVVNAQNMAQHLSQMVKVAVCGKGVDGYPCMGDCGGSNLPFGVVSRCEQQYLQKRLLSLSTTGKEIVTSMFWLPSACLCKTFRSTP